jgi:hypothetical protein
MARNNTMELQVKRPGHSDFTLRIETAIRVQTLKELINGQSQSHSVNQGSKSSSQKLVRIPENKLVYYIKEEIEI